MYKVDSRKFISDIAKKSYRGNKKRNTLTIIAIILTTFLITSIIGIGITYWESISQRQVRMAGIDYNIALSEPREDQVEIIKKMDKVKYAGLVVKCGIIDKIDNEKVSGIQLYWADDISWEKQHIPAFEFVKGNYPKNKDEIILSTANLNKLGIGNPKIGMDINANYYPLSSKVDKKESTDFNFKLSGYYKDYTGKSKAYISKEFYDSTGARQTDFTQGSLKISLKNNLYRESEIIDIVNKLDMKENQFLESDENLILDFIKTVVILLGLLIMIFLSGYLFIYNTLYISISRDIRFYGQLKTIGTTSKQIKKIIYMQAIFNCLIGITIGLVASFIVSNLLISKAIKLINQDLSTTVIGNINPLVYIIATLFSIIVVLIGTRKPAKIAGEISPVEAMKFILSSKGKENSKKIKSLNLRSIFRNKKQSVIIIASFVLSIIIFININVIVRGNDGKRVLNAIVSDDIDISNERIEEGENLITEDKISQVEHIKGVKEVRAIKSTEVKLPYQEKLLGEFYKELYSSRYSPGNYEEDIKAYKNGEEVISNIKGKFNTRLVGIDENAFNKINEKKDKKIDKEAFEKGKLAFLENEHLFVEIKDVKDKEIRFSLIENEIKKEEIVKVADTDGNPSSFAGGYNPVIIISENYYDKIVENPVVELLYVDYEEPYSKEVEEEVKSVFKDVKDISFNSKLDSYNEMKDQEKQVKILGYSMGIILASLAILNYINMMAANIENRLKEFAILESIGMTRKQIIKMLSREGFAYGIISLMISAIIGIPLSYFVFKSTNEYMLLKYSLPILMNVILFTIIIIVSVVVPPIIYKFSQKESLIDQLNDLDI